MEETIKKEIQSLKKKTLYLEIGMIVLTGIFYFTNFGLMKDYAAIRDYYREAVRQNSEIFSNLESVSAEIEQFLSRRK